LNTSVLSYQILYALSATAWSGYMSVENESRLNKVLRKAKRYEYTDSISSHFLWTLGTVRWEQYYYYSRVVPAQTTVYFIFSKKTSLNFTSLRPRGHSVDLPGYQYNLTM